MVKSFALILFTIINGDVYVAPVTYYDSLQQCLESKNTLMQPYKNKNVDVRGLCTRIIPE